MSDPDRVHLAPLPLAGVRAIIFIQPIHGICEAAAHNIIASFMLWGGHVIKPGIVGVGQYLRECHHRFLRKLITPYVVLDHFV